MTVLLGLLMLAHPVAVAPLWALPAALGAGAAVIVSALPRRRVFGAVAACSAVALAVPGANLWDAMTITAYLLAVESAETAAPLGRRLRQQAPLVACAIPVSVAVALMTYADTASLGDWVRRLVIIGPITAAAGFLLATAGRR